MSQIKVDIDILDFVKTGEFGFLKLGESKEEIISQGFPPEDWLNGETKESSRIWRYGNIELHFDNGNHLSGIFTDYVSDIDCGESISISNWWILPNGKASPDLLSTIKELNYLNLDYTKTTFNVGYIELKLSNGIYFSFDHPDENPDEEHNNWTMTVIGKK
ncbi:hypothetical protein ATE84_3622 [Aquimarina sp. MAR_2010_214]|uniref:hypothetical protein n=1 Tax=Aquimarina sp. MAR_2010_214 TaxID=1250026 RepID=UPI000C7017C4|nr:hypothetical protein [Aquimarina sp. MAR_2010_214]PKV51537.1 hypothetical protein ATE84_3622 [Aquimarina sp. MAR_2010_214]